MTSKNGFVWPKSGPVAAPDWAPTKSCGHGLHGLRSGDNDPGEWYGGPILAVDVEDEKIVDLCGKCKFPSGVVVYCGDMEGFCKKFPGCWYGAKVTGGDRSTVTGGHYSTVTGRDDATVTGGHNSVVTGGHYSTVTGGRNSTVTSGNYSVVTGGNAATVTGGDRAILSIYYHDGIRRRLAVAYVGENGILKNTAYKFLKGSFVEA